MLKNLNKNTSIGSKKIFICISSVTVILILMKGAYFVNFQRRHREDFCSRDNASDFWDHQSSHNSSRNLCSIRSEKRGAHQKVVSFSFWGEMKTAYWNGIVENLELMEVLYPGWVLRLHVSRDLVTRETQTQLCDLHNRYSSLDVCMVQSMYDYGRFLPLVDPQVSVMVSRDLDSRLTAREQAAVEDWLETGLTFHVMRDNPHHGAVILAGMFGARLDTGDRKLFHSGMEKIFQDVRLRGDHWYKGLDQMLLRNRIWPLIEDRACVHDSYLCQAYKSNNWRPFPTQRRRGPSNFVGSKGRMEVNQTCPVECRPHNHQQWILC